MLEAAGFLAHRDELFSPHDRCFSRYTGRARALTPGSRSLLAQHACVGPVGLFRYYAGLLRASDQFVS